MRWREKLKTYFNTNIKRDEACRSFYAEKNISIENVGLHLAIFNEPFLQLLITGQKTIESRFSINRTSPFYKVTTGDIVFIKKSGGPICGFFIVGKVYYYDNPDEKKLKDIREKFSKKICAGSVEHFWEERSSAKCVSLFEVSHVKRISPIEIDKRDRTAWVPLMLANTIPLNATA